MKPGDIDRLYKLREKRKEKALELVTMRHALFMRAEQQRAEAAAAVIEHVELTLEHEKTSFAGMMGKVMSHADIGNARSELTVMVLQLEDLMAQEKARGEQSSAAQAALTAANEAFRQHYRSAEKLRFLIQEQKRMAQRKGLAASEAGEDEMRGRRQGLGSER
ncbi:MULTISPECIES: hypothetical protein [Rhodomicrobium]|uniref:hypothetical protein n=1 Tax=Rhodomicrobium TaxID=1068 RepID=UPI000B4B55AD|nr:MULTISPECIES: hypothetical protein [Rhodomicrobium]